MRRKKEDFTEFVASLDLDITKYIIEAEANRDFTLLTKTNSFWKTKMEKEKSMKALDIGLGKLENNIKAMGE